MNPALTGRCFLLISFGSAMTNFSVDGMSSATPLAALRAGEAVSFSQTALGYTEVAGGIALAHAQHPMADALAVAPGRGVHDEQQVAARHEGVGDAPVCLLDGHVRGQGRVGQLAEQADVQQGADQAVPPFRPEGRDGAADLAAAGQFHGMALAVIEAQRAHDGKAGQGPGKTGGRILAAGKDDQGLPVGKGGLMGH